MIDRKKYRSIWKELSAEKSMVFLAGPRQCGKTTLAEMIATEFSNHQYFNWDIDADRRMLIRDPVFFQNIVRKDASTPLVVLDEIHKYKEWKNYLKGIYDQFHSEFLFLVSGSGRLDLYQKGGDSLAGRYYLFHLWPFTLAELEGNGATWTKFRKDPTCLQTDATSKKERTWRRLAAFSGVPEPYLAQKAASYRRWSTTYHRQLIREDIRDLSGIKHVHDVELLFSLLPSKVASPLSIPGLSTDLRVAYNTVKDWLDIFERFYLTFSITPWTDRIARAIHKEKKVYLFDYAGIEDTGAKFENMAALELFRAVSNWNDMGWGDFGLHYIRTKEGREVDFLVSQNGRPMFLVETKQGDDTPAPNLLRYMSALHVPGIQLLDRAEGFKRMRYNGNSLLVAPAAWWFASLP
jgi:predicted AAA+ superfamily ATPase